MLWVKYEARAKGGYRIGMLWVDWDEAKEEGGHHIRNAMGEI